MPGTRLNTRRMMWAGGHGLMSHPLRSLQTIVTDGNQAFPWQNMISYHLEGSSGQIHHVLCQPEAAVSLRSKETEAPAPRLPGPFQHPGGILIMWVSDFTFKFLLFFWKGAFKIVQSLGPIRLKDSPWWQSVDSREDRMDLRPERQIPKTWGWVEATDFQVELRAHTKALWQERAK